MADFLKWKDQLLGNVAFFKIHTYLFLYTDISYLPNERDEIMANEQFLSINYAAMHYMARIWF